MYMLAQRVNVSYIGVIREREQRRFGEKMAQRAFTRRIQASQVSTGELYDHDLPEEAAPEADVEGGGAEHRDPLDADSQRTTVNAFLEYTNRRAEADETTSAAEEHLLRFSQRVDRQDDPARDVASVFIDFADQWECAVQRDRTIQSIKNSVVEDCQPEGEATDSDAAQVGRPPRPGTEAVYQHLLGVFQHLFTWEEIRNATLFNLWNRFGLCLEYCYQVCKEYVKKYGAYLAAHVTFGFICTIGGYLAKYLWKVYFYRKLMDLGGWVAMVTGVTSVNQYSVAALIGVGLLLYGVIGYFFKS